MSVDLELLKLRRACLSNSSSTDMTFSVSQSQSVSGDELDASKQTVFRETNDSTGLHAA